MLTSKHTVKNTVTAPEDYLSLLQPSEPSATLFETNTYYNTIVLTKTLLDKDVPKIISTSDVVRQVVITELLPSKSTSVMTSYIAIDAEGNISPAEKGDILAASSLLSATDVVKTYYVTYTYFNTYLVNGSTIVRTNVSTTSDIVTEKLYIYPTKRVHLPQKTFTTKQALPIQIESIANSIIDEDEFNEENQLYNDLLQQTVNVYATKTLMTTFTYFTTMLKEASNTDEVNASINKGDMSTVINSNTRVVENVVTESIPTSFLPSTAIHKLKLLFFGDNEHSHIHENKFVTVATLIDGQSLEITAVKNVVQSAYNNLQSTSTHKDVNVQIEELVDIDTTKNELESDQDVAGSDLEVLETILPNTPSSNNIGKRPVFETNATKIVKTTPSPVSNLIGSINFNNGLKVLRPMIDAVAGLINTNFKLNWNNDTIPSGSQHTSIHHTFPTPLYHSQGKLPHIPDLILNYTRTEAIPQPLPNIEPAVGHSRNPIYIPVNNNIKDNFDTPTTQQLIEQITSKNFLPPEIINHLDTHSNEINKLTVNSKNKTPLIDGGIPISPGEVITANSDIILGRPLNGNRPRIPLSSNSYDKPIVSFDKAVSINLMPSVTPLSKLLGKTHGDSHQISSVRNEAYIGPPPPLPHVKDSIKGQNVGNTPAHSNKIPIYRNKPIRLLNKPVLPPHQTVLNQVHLNRIHSQNHKNMEHNRFVLRPNVIPIKHVIQENGNQFPTNKQPQQKPVVLHATANIPQQHMSNHIVQKPNSMHQYVLNNVVGGGLRDIEIQRVPEVFSTDLPPIHIYNVPQEIISLPTETVEPSKINLYHTRTPTLNQLPEVVESSSGQPLFVNIQPSQIAKVVIPSGSSSAIIFGGNYFDDHLKSGEYFDDPTYPHEDQVVSIRAKPSVSGLENANEPISDANASNSNGNIVLVKGYSPIISNQKVNVDSHVLSQDVDMHPPPIVFRNQDTKNIPITSGTYSNGPETNFNEVEYANHQRYHHHHKEQHHSYQYEQIPPVRNLISNNHQSPFRVDIESVNLGMSDLKHSHKIVEHDLTDNLHSPSLNDQIVDQHKEDDCENEQGEVIQESNAVPQLVSSSHLHSNQANINQISTFNKPISKTIDEMRTPLTQTEANSLWERYPQTTELSESYRITSLSGMPKISYPSITTTYSPVVLHNNRSPFKAPLNLSIPHIAPDLVNEMYFVNQTTTKNSHNSIRLMNPEQFYNQKSIDQRPPKYANGVSNHISLIPIQNIPSSSHYAPPGFDRYKSNHHRQQESRRPILSQQKPFARLPVQLKPAQSTNHTVHNIELVESNWHSNRPLVYLRPNALITTAMPVPTQTTNIASSIASDQTPQTSEIIHELSTQRSLINNFAAYNSDSKVSYYNNIPSNFSQGSNIYDLSRGKPFAYHPPTTNLNTGEMKRPINNIKNISNDGKAEDVDLSVDVSEIFDFKESINPHNFASVTEANAVITEPPQILNSQKNTISISSYNREKSYPKMPATEMQPPPSQEIKYNVFTSKKPLPSIPYHQNVLSEEVKGLHPPPIPKLVIKTNPNDLKLQNHGFVLPSHKIHNHLAQSTVSLPILAPNPGIPFVPMPPHKIKTNRPSTYEITDESTKSIYVETTTTSVLPITLTKNRQSSQAVEYTTVESDFISEIKGEIRKPYEFITKSVAKTDPTNEDSTQADTPTTMIAPIIFTTTSSKNSTGIDLNEYVQFKIRSNDNRIHVKPSTEKTLYVTQSNKKIPLKVSSNGHMPQSPKYDETFMSGSHAFEETTPEEVNEFIPLPTSLLNELIPLQTLQTM